MIPLKSLPLLLLPLVLAVNRNDFKTCDQSAFCKRHRAITENTGYELLENTLTYSGPILEATIKNAENSLALRVYGLEDGTMRIQIDEPKGALRSRFIPTFALDGEPKQLAFRSVDTSDGTTIIVNGDQKAKAVIHHKPLLIDVYNGQNELILQVNKNGKLKVEEFRTKDESKEYPEGFWEESFKHFRDSKPFGSSSVGVDVSFVGFTHAFGLPEHADTFALKQTVGNSDPYRLFNLDVFEYEINNPMALYVAVPYIVAHRKERTAGALWLNAAETWVDTSTSTSAGVIQSVIDKVIQLYSTINAIFSLTPGDATPHFDAHFISEAGLVDLFVFSGPTPQEVQKQYSKLTGVTPLPPIFSIAYHQCRWNYNDEQDVAMVNAKFDEYDIPMDVIWLDIEHTDGKKYFTWDQNKFGHPKEMIDNVASRGRKMVTIIDPHIKKDDGYNVYKDAKDLGLFVKKSDGTSDFEGNCWPGNSAYLDFLHPETRKYWAAQFKFDRYAGSTPNLFTWNDMNEPSVFSGPEITMDRDSLHYGGIEHREVHNMYGLFYHSATFEGQLQRTNGRDRPFILTRSGFVGTQRTAAIWTGDNTADWGHLAIAAPMILSLSVAGNVFVGADVGGFFGNPDEQLLTRWYQTAAFQPFFRAHAHIDTKRREPWLFSEDTRLIIRDAIRRRYQLLPLWYTLFQEHSVNGAPPMRPLWYEFPQEEAFFAEEKAWMVGNALYVRPIVEKDTYSTTVILPKGQSGKTRWYEWETGKEEKPGPLYVDAPISHVPVFQRGGTIIPTWQRVRRAASLMTEDPYTLIVGLDERGNAEGTVYIDDANTHDYRDKKFTLAKFSYKTNSPSEAIITGSPVEGIFEAKNWIEKIEVRGLLQEPSHISIIRSSDPTASLQFTYDRDYKLLTIRKPNVLITQSYKMKILF